MTDDPRTRPQRNGETHRSGRGPRRTTINDVARHAGVSVATVSNALNNPSLVADETRERISAAIEELGFVRNHSARQLRSGRSVAIGLVVLAMDPFFSELARGVEEAMNQTGCVLILCNSGGSTARQEQYLQLLAEHRVRGLIISPTLESSPRLESFRDWRTPLVFAVGGEMVTAGHCSVAGDFLRDTELAVEHLLSLGHRRIGFVNGPLTMQLAADRHRAIRRALERSDLDPAEAMLEVNVDTFDTLSGERALQRLLASAPRVTAVFAASDMLAVGALRGIKEAGLAVPDDIAVVGIGDVEFAAMSVVPLTTVRYPAFEMGRAAAELLLAEEREHPHTHRNIRFAPELVVRSSTVGMHAGGFEREGHQ